MLGNKLPAIRTNKYIFFRIRQKICDKFFGFNDDHCLESKHTLKFGLANCVTFQQLPGNNVIKLLCNTNNNCML